MVQNYDALDMGEIFEEADRFVNDEENSGGSNKNFLEKFVIMPEKEGFVIVRFLPPAVGKKFYCATRTHRLIKDEKDKKKGGRNFHCPRELVTGKGGKKYWVDVDPKNPCPVCMYSRGVWSWVEAAGGRDTPEGKVHHAEYSRIKAIERYYYNVMVRYYDKAGNIEKSEGPKILSVGKTLHEKVIRTIAGDPKAGLKGLGNVSDIATGRDFRIVKKLRPVTFYPYYDNSAFLDPSALGTPEEVEEWLNNLNDIAALRVLKPISELDTALQKYTGALPDDDTSFDMSRYRKKTEAETLEEQVAAAKCCGEKPCATKPVVVDGDAALAEQDFLDGIDKELDKVE